MGIGFWRRCESCKGWFTSKNGRQTCNGCMMEDVVMGQDKTAKRNVDKANFFKLMESRPSPGKHDTHPPKSKPSGMDKLVNCPVRGCEWEGSLRDLVGHRKEVHTR